MIAAPAARAVRRVSGYFHLGVTQPSLDFVDVDIHGDTRVYFDPTALLGLPSPWANECIGLIQDFFGHVLGLIERAENRAVLRILQHLREPNETHLGLSTARARGHGLGRRSTVRLWQALRSSEAAHSGLLRDLEDTILMVEGVAADIVSDIATNIIRGPLINFTQEQCGMWGIPLEPGVAVGPLWDPRKHEWFVMHTPMPMTPAGPLLLMPKVLVRKKLEYDSNDYLHNYMLPYLEDQEIAAKTAIVTVLKSGQPKVTKKDLAEKYGSGKAMVVEQTRLHPEVLQRYRKAKREAEAVRRPPLGHEEFAEAEATPLPDWDALLDRVVSTPVGNSGADEYHEAILQLLRPLLHPLTNARKEVKLHRGRKRVDIVFENATAEGFFWWLGQHYPAPYIFVECKNYGRELGNPELDQISGRFSPSRGQFGIIVCRSLEDPNAFAQRCRDTAADVRGYVVALTDQDLTALVDAARLAGYSARAFDLIKKRFERLIL